MNTLSACDFMFLVSQTRLMLSSYRHWTRKSLWPKVLEIRISRQSVVTFLQLEYRGWKVEIKEGN